LLASQLPTEDMKALQQIRMNINNLNAEPTFAPAMQKKVIMVKSLHYSRKTSEYCKLNQSYG